LSWNIGASRIISRTGTGTVTVRAAMAVVGRGTSTVIVWVAAVSVVASLVSFGKTTAGRVAWALLTTCAPEHMAVGTIVWVPVEMMAMHVLPF